MELDPTPARRVDNLRKRPAGEARVPGAYGRWEAGPPSPWRTERRRDEPQAGRAARRRKAAYLRTAPNGGAAGASGEPPRSSRGSRGPVRGHRRGIEGRPGGAPRDTAAGGHTSSLVLSSARNGPSTEPIGSVRPKGADVPSMRQTERPSTRPSVAPSEAALANYLGWTHARDTGLRRLEVAYAPCRCHGQW